MADDAAGRGATGESNEVSGGRDTRRASPCFLFSYAHPGNGAQPAMSRAQGFVETFYSDVYELVGELLPTLAGEEAGYLDKRMGGGKEWSEDLGRAVGNCQVFVPLISPRYLHSEWCARELWAFTQRKVEPRRPQVSPTGRAILPVRWAPLAPEQNEPSELERVQLFSPPALGQPEVTGTYEERGVYGLLSTSRAPIYQEVTWQLANQIVAIASNYWVHPGSAELLRIAQDR